jgi:hypothetical protein
MLNGSESEKTERTFEEATELVDRECQENDGFSGAGGYLKLMLVTSRGRDGMIMSISKTNRNKGTTVVNLYVNS